jgi:hypothetical protein
MLGFAHHDTRGDQHAQQRAASSDRRLRADEAQAFDRPPTRRRHPGERRRRCAVARRRQQCAGRDPHRPGVRSPARSASFSPSRTTPETRGRIDQVEIRRPALHIVGCSRHSGVASLRLSLGAAGWAITTYSPLSPARRRDRGPARPRLHAGRRCGRTALPNRSEARAAPGAAISPAARGSRRRCRRSRPGRRAAPARIRPAWTGPRRRRTGGRRHRRRGT